MPCRQVAHRGVQPHVPYKGKVAAKPTSPTPSALSPKPYVKRRKTSTAAFFDDSDDDSNDEREEEEEEPTDELEAYLALPQVKTDKNGPSTGGATMWTSFRI